MHEAAFSLLSTTAQAIEEHINMWDSGNLDGKIRSSRQYSLLN